MRNIKTRTKTLKKQLSKCDKTFYAYNEIQFRYGEELDKRQSIIKIQCNVKLKGCELGDNYTSDFYCLKIDGNYMVRECVYMEKLKKPLTIKLLDCSRNYWLSKGVEDWGIVLNETK